MKILPETLINGKLNDQINVRDRGLHYGDGLFETIAICNNKLVLWDRHMARLMSGCDRLNLPRPDELQLQKEAISLFHGIEKGVLKIIYTRGSGERGYQLPEKSEPMRILQRHAWPDYSERNKIDGIKMRLCETRLGLNPALAGLKHLNRLEQVMGRTEWQNYNQLFEGIMLDVEGNVIAGTMCNVFLVLDDILITPDLTKCGINGVIRDFILDMAEELNIAHSVRKVSLEEIHRAAEVFITNSLIGVWPVKQFNDSCFKIGPITKRISNQLIVYYSNI